MKIVVSPNPYRDKQFKHARQACQILKEAGAEVSLCLPFDVDRSFEIPSDLRFREIQKEIRTADMLICFGGDGTILHLSLIHIYAAKLGKATHVDENKNTFVRLYGIGACSKMIESETKTAIDALGCFENSDFLVEMARQLALREY